MDQPSLDQSKILKPKSILLRMAFMGGIYGGVVLGTPLLLAGLLGTPNYSYASWMVGLWFCVWGVMIGALGGIVLGVCYTYISKRGMLLWIVLVVTGSLYGVCWELFLWHRVDGILLMLGGIGGVLIPLLSRKIPHKN